MKLKRLFLASICVLSLSSCLKQEFERNREQQIKDNVETVFGVQFDETHDWCTTANSTIRVIPNTARKIQKIQVLVTEKDEETYYIKLLNQSPVDNNNALTITFDVPYNYSDLLVAFIDETGAYYYQRFNLGDTEVYYDNSSRAATRAFSDYTVPSITPTITGTVETFASQRGWLPGEVFYTWDNQSISGSDYSDDFKSVFRTIIFNYFPNGRSYNNLPQIKKSGYYNESVYPITTGDDPIILSPVYKNDGGYHEISEAELYYYYFKGDLTVAQIEALPKYRVIDLSTVYTNDNNNNIAKSPAFAVAYFGDGTPAVGTQGSFNFPKGYKIGFAYKSNTTSDNKKKQGEVYGDGRLNYNINSYGNFKTSGLAQTDPRMAWMTVNQKMFLCVESGTDKDFNDLIIEVEGGVEPITVTPDEPEASYYTFLFEDHPIGDYDLNDVVIRGRRIDATHVEYTLMACGANDELYIQNINGQVINKDAEVHSLFGRGLDFVNTVKGDHADYVVDQIVVDKNFSFLDATTQPYIYDATNNNTVKLATVGQDPHGIMVPSDFKWAQEMVCINRAYPQFNSWGRNKVTSTDWYKFPDAEYIY